MVAGSQWSILWRCLLVSFASVDEEDSRVVFYELLNMLGYDALVDNASNDSEDGCLCSRSAEEGWFILGRILCLDRGPIRGDPASVCPHYEPFIITQLALLSTDKKNHLIMMRVPIASMFYIVRLSRRVWCKNFKENKSADGTSIFHVKR